MEIYSDQLLGFTLPMRNARGRVVRLNNSLDAVLAAHDYPAPIKHLLAEALVLTALMGGLLKGDGAQLTMQARTNDGAVQLMVCDYRDGKIRGYTEFDAERVASFGDNAELTKLFGQGHLAIIFETDKGQRYQGIVPLEGDRLAEACESYFVQSEQLPTLVRVGVSSGANGSVGSGLLIQHLPEGEEGRERLHVRQDHPDWEHVCALAETTSHAELVDTDLSLDALIWRLFHEEVEILAEPGAHLDRGCRCSREHYEAIIARFPAEERDEMRNEEGLIVVDCAFCAKEFVLNQ